MKTHFILETVKEDEFSVIAINSHAKAYKLCWNMNKALKASFEKVEDQSVNNEMMFSRYKSVNDEGVEYNIVTNRSKKGYLIPNQKKINYFLVINNQTRVIENNEVIRRLRKNKEILFIFELDLKNNQYIDRFIFNDKKN